MNVFESLLLIGFFQINLHCLMIYYEPYCIKKILYFEHQIKLQLLNIKNNTLVPLAMVCVSVSAPSYLVEVVRLLTMETIWDILEKQLV
jgi:hypothetical protein